jgi:hypothetical protein
MKLIFIFCVLTLAGVSCTSSPTEMQRKKADQQVDKIMEAMDLPEYGLVKLSKEGQFTSADFTQAGKDLIVAGRDLAKIDHPEEDFNEFTKNMIKAMTEFELVLESKDSEKIKNSWSRLRATCTKCHDVYD